jgi:hypothetical protein
MRSWVRFPCSAPVRVRISAAPPRCSPDAHPLGFLPRRVSGEQRGGAVEILSRAGVEHGERTQLRIRRLLGPSIPIRDVGHAFCLVQSKKYDAFSLMLLFDMKCYVYCLAPNKAEDG